MARFQFNLRSIVTHTAARAGVSQRTLRALRLEDTAEAPRGPGWFDSSWDLVRGLEVREGLPSDARLHEWLASCLRAEPTTPSVSARAERDEKPRTRLVPAAPHGALRHALKLGDLDLGVAAEVTHLDEFGEFRIDGLELV